MRSALAAKKLRAYLARAKRAVKVAHENHPDVLIDDAALELKMLKYWLNNGISEIKQIGLDKWTETV